MQIIHHAIGIYQLLLFYNIVGNTALPNNYLIWWLWLIMVMKYNLQNWIHCKFVNLWSPHNSFDMFKEFDTWFRTFSWTVLTKQNIHSNTIWKQLEKHWLIIDPTLTQVHISLIPSNSRHVWKGHLPLNRTWKVCSNFQT